jgi:hypothetical protein
VTERQVSIGLRWFVRAARLAAQDPGEGLDRAIVRLRSRGWLPAEPIPSYAPTRDWEQHLHDELGVTWPCSAIDGFPGIWSEITARLEAQGLALGRGTYGGWDDADPAFGRAIWCLAAHLRPRDIIETGVARGVTSRIILEALDRQSDGHLWSIDQPALDSDLHGEIGAAVPDRLRGRWTYVAGTSRRRLPELVSGRQIDLFVHDSLHTKRNVNRELRAAWAALRPGGAIVADDIDRNDAFAAFAATTPGPWALVAPADDGAACFGVLLKPRHE